MRALLRSPPFEFLSAVTAEMTSVMVIFGIPNAKIAGRPQVVALRCRALNCAHKNLPVFLLLLKSLLQQCLRAHVAVEHMYKGQGRSLAPRLKTALFIQAAFDTESLLATWEALGTRSEGSNIV